MAESKLTPEEQQVYQAELEAVNLRISQREREIRSATAKLEIDQMIRKNLLVKLERGGVRASDLGAAPKAPGGAATAAEEQIQVALAFEEGTVGLSEAIRAVIRAAGKPVRPPYVVAELRRRKFQYTATTPLVTRVGNEMRRMARAGVLQRRGKKYLIGSGGDSDGEAGVSAAS